MAERVRVVVPDNQKAFLRRGGKLLLQWPPSSVIEQDLQDGDEIVYEDLKPARQASELEVLQAKVARQYRELDETTPQFANALDDVLDALIAGNILRLDALPNKTQKVIQKRQAIRARIDQLDKDIKKLTEKP
ncbi:MAG TPA: hypothetical protein PKG77_19560 [Phycisphaerae bacterium]|nr:hypothetical protein [Phycisphaerae bacterium]HQL75976.1 hypothetical protein [Phycisphaerae bacterium]